MILYPGCRLTSFALPWAWCFWAFSPRFAVRVFRIDKVFKDTLFVKVCIALKPKSEATYDLMTFPLLLLYHLRRMRLAHLPNLVTDGEKGDADDDKYCQHEVEDKGW